MAARAGAGGTVEVQRLADGRFVGQGFALTVPLPPPPYGGEAIRPALRAAFEREYRRKFARSPPDVDLEFVAARVAVRGAAHCGGADATMSGGGPEAARKGSRAAWFAEAGGYVETPVYDRARLGSGDCFDGPALVEDAGSTLVVGPGARCAVTPSGSIIVEMGIAK